MADTLSFQGGQSFNVNNGVATAANDAASQGLSGLGVSSYSSYVPPNTSQPVNGNQVVGGNPINIPPSPQNTNPGAFVNSLPGAQTQTPPPASSTPNLDLATTGDLSKDPAYAAALQQYNQSQQAYQQGAAQLPSQANLLTQAQGQFNVPQNLQTVQNLTTQLAQLQAQFNNQSAATETQGIQHGVPAVFYQGEQAAIQRQQAVQAGALATQIQAAQGNYQLAETLAEKTSELQFQDAQNEINNLLNFVNLNQQNLTVAEKNATTKMQQQAVLLQQQLDQQKTLRTLALQIGVTKPFMNIGGTVYSSATGQPFANPEQAAAAGVDVSKWSNVQSVDPTKISQKFQQVGLDANYNPVYGFVNEAKGTITPITPTGGIYQATGNDLTVNTPNPSKVIAGYDFTTYATDPNWGNAVQSILQKVPQVSVLPSGAAGPENPNNPTSLDNYIKSVAPSSKISGQMILTAAKQYGVDPRVLTAILQQESQFGTAGVGAKTFNPGNVGNTDSGATKNMGNWQDGINAVAANMAKRVTTQLASSAKTGLDFSQYGLLANSNFNPSNSTDKFAQIYLDTYIKGGTVPTPYQVMGKTSVSPTLFANVSTRARDLFHQATGEALPTPAVVKGYQNIINTNNQMSNNLKIQEQTVAQNVDLSLQNMNANGLNSSGFKPLDSLINTIQNNLQDPNVGQFLAQNATIQNELGSLLAVKNASGTTVYDKLSSAGIIGSTDSPQVVQQKIQILLKEAGNFADSISAANARAYKIIDPFLQDPNNPIVQLSQEKGFDLQKALSDGHKYDEIMQALTQS